MSRAMYSVAFTLTVTMRSDWHVGIGSGRHGAIDRMVDRDTDDLPYLPATTLRGIWRDAAERLALGLDEGDQQGGWSRAVEAVFGNQPALSRGTPSGAPPQAGALELRDARLPDRLRMALAGDEDPGRARLRQALVFVKPGVAIHPRSGRAKPEALRFDEVVRSGAMLIAQGALHLPGEAGADSEAGRAMRAVLVAAAALVERLGGKRRRGTGRCDWTVSFAEKAASPMSVDQAIEILSRDAPAIPVISGNAEFPAAYSDAAVGDTWETVEVDLTLTSPLVIADAVLGNVVTSLDFVPGTYLLPHVSRCLKGGETDVAAHISVGDIRVSPALPVDLDGRRGLPVPLAWAEIKNVRQGAGDHRRIVNRAAEPALEGEQLKPLRDGYAVGGVAPAVMPNVEKTVRTHSTIDDAVQRPTADVVGVYAYEAIKPDSVFRFAVRVRRQIAKHLPAGWRDRLATGTLRLGRAAMAGYGTAALSPANDAVHAVSGSAHASSEGEPKEKRSHLAVLFASDLLLRTPLLGAGSDVEAVVQALTEALGFEVDQVLETGPGDGAEHCGLRARRIESWSTAWQLPRPSLIAIQAGSYIRVKTKDGSEPSAEALQRLQGEGLGERRAEGYGELLVNPDLLSAATSEVPVSQQGDPGSERRGSIASPGEAKPPLADMPDGDALRAFAAQVEEAAWRKAIAEAAFTLAVDKERRQEALGWRASGDRGNPPMSQLGALRSTLGAPGSDDSPDMTVKWIEQVRANDSRSGTWGGALKTLSVLVTGEDQVWRLLAPEDGVPGTLPAPLVSDPGTLKARLRVDAVRALLLAAIRAHKRDLENASEKAA